MPKTKTKSYEKSVNASFKPYRILVTGANGFIGSKVTQRLREMGHDVLGYDIKRKQDILNLPQLEEAIKDVDIVYHIAAQADLTQMSDNPDVGRRGVLINVDGTHNVAYLCAKHKKWLIYASTVCVYGNVKEHPESEDTTLPNPSELYACSKYAGEWIVKGYGLNYGMPWTIQRYATIYGEGMRPALGMHVFFRQALKGEPITVHGDGKQVRTLTYIDDLVDGIVAPLTSKKREKNAKGEIFNLSATTQISAKRMANDVKTITESDSPIEHIEQRDNQTLEEDFDVSKAKKLLGWEAKTPWGQGLKKTYQWIKEQI